MWTAGWDRCERSSFQLSALSFQLSARSRQSSAKPPLGVRRRLMTGDWRLSSDVDHGARGGDEVGFSDVVALFLVEDDFANEGFQFGVGGAAAHLGVQVVIPDGEEAGSNFAVGGDADAAAVSAEGVRDGRDDADFAQAVFEAVAPGGF